MLWNIASQAEKRQVDAVSHSRNAIIILLVLAITFVTVQNLTVHAILSYTLTLSSSRIQEANNPGVVMTLNVSGTTSGAIYGFAWNVTDPSGTLNSYFSAGAANGPVLTLNAVYPRDFSGASVKYNGTYRVNIFQTYPAPTTLAATGKFYAGLTDSLFYKRTAQIFVLAQGYASNENITIRISHAGILASGFPKYQLADTTGTFSYSWQIPVSTPLGSNNVTLSGQVTVKKPADSQIFTVQPTSVSITQLAANVTLLQGTQVADFSFSSTYPDGTQAITGTATVRVIEPNGITNHLVSATYNATSKLFQGTYRLSSSSPSGGWAAIIDPAGFDDGYGNVGPSTSVVRGFIVEPAASSQTPPTSTLTYLLLVALILMAAALAVVISWVLFFGRKKVQRNVLKVDFQSIEREAARVENRDFFTKVHDQLKQQQQTKPEEATKDG
jgi:hypothetical protein